MAATLRLGTCELGVSEVLLFSASKCIRVNRSDHDLVDLVVGGQILARGEIVLVNESIDPVVGHICH